jgi:hypothetical protein
MGAPGEVELSCTEIARLSSEACLRTTASLPQRTQRCRRSQREPELLNILQPLVVVLGVPLPLCVLCGKTAVSVGTPVYGFRLACVNVNSSIADTAQPFNINGLNVQFGIMSNTLLM